MKNPFCNIHWSSQKVISMMQDVLSGNIFTKEAVRKQWPLIALIAFFIFVYINNGFKTVGQQTQIKQLQKEIREARFTMLDLSADYVKISKSSAIAKQLQADNSRVKEPSQPAILVE